MEISIEMVVAGFAILVGILLFLGMITAMALIVYGIPVVPDKDHWFWK